LQQWWAAAGVGIVVALGSEFATIRPLGHRLAHALGYGLGVAAFVLTQAHLFRPRAERAPPWQPVALSVALGATVFAASWFLGGTANP
jgi:hypothetical protein